MVISSSVTWDTFAKVLWACWNTNLNAVGESKIKPVYIIRHSKHQQSCTTDEAAFVATGGLASTTTIAAAVISCTISSVKITTSSTTHYTTPYATLVWLERNLNRVRLISFELVITISWYRIFMKTIRLVWFLWVFTVCGALSTVPTVSIICAFNIQICSWVCSKSWKSKPHRLWAQVFKA